MRLGLYGMLGLALALPALVHAAPDTAMAAKQPLLIEVFTSKYCPNCPQAEAKMKRVAAENADVLVVFEHVDYWDRGPNQKDPHGLAEVTQRQYDYSNTLGKRPGQVYTPMPLLDGQIPVGAPLFLTWGSAFDRGRSLPAKASLSLTTAKDGALDIAIPSALRDASNQVWVMGISPVEDSKAWRVTGLAEAHLSGDKARLPAPMMPEGQDILVLLQKGGPGAVLAMGRMVAK